MNIKESFGNRVRELRNRLGISQEKFALKIDMDRTYFASVESGKRNISIENIYKISKGLEVSMGELFKEVYARNAGADEHYFFLFFGVGTACGKRLFAP